MDIDSDNDDDDNSDCDSDSSDKQQQHQSDKHTAEHLLHQKSPLSATTAAAAQISTVRPQIIVTPRKVAAAIESVTAAVLAKNKKSSLSECVSNETPLNLLPSSFSVFEINNPTSSAAAQSSSSLASGTMAGASTSREAASSTAATTTSFKCPSLSFETSDCSSIISISSSHGTTSGSPSKSVIVRAGSSVCYFVLLNYLWFYLIQRLF